MGTRGLLGLIIQAQRHAAYNHFDSYPTGLGQEIVNFINGLKPEDYATMEENLRQITVSIAFYTFIQLLNRAKISPPGPYFLSYL
jgi:hypothetical protein